MTCIVSQGLDTIGATHFDSKWSPSSHDYVSGDSIVPLTSSLKICEMWQNSNNRVEIVTTDKLGHIPIVRDEKVIEIVKKAAAF